MSGYLYKVKYEPGVFQKEDANGAGLCDALVVLSILYPPDGSYSILPMTCDGRRSGESLSAKEQFKAWMMWGHQISRMPGLDANRREMAQMPFEIIRKAILGDKK